VVVTPFSGAVLGVDWGTTNRRVFRIEGSTVTTTERDPLGVTGIARNGYPAEVAAIRARFGDLPMLLAGMVGSNIGWRSVPYVAAPLGMAALAGGLSWIDERTAIVPGVSIATVGRADVMRGEEVQVLGAVAAGLVPPDALVCQPGTHCKWVTLAGGEILDFTTAMTGELFALLRAHGLLSPQLDAEVTAGSAFREGVDAGKARDLAASLFGIRAAKLLGRRDDADAASYLSGLLIGSDVTARLTRPGDVYILADPALGELYAIALAENGRTAHVVDSHAAFVAGIVAIGKLIA
jgi:2-dehydro-3-deoxygalactonokinase